MSRGKHRESGDRLHRAERTLERWQEAAKNLEEMGNVLAAGFLKQNKDGRGKEDADALMADIVLACMALHHVAEFATDKCRIIPLPGKNGG